MSWLVVTERAAQDAALDQARGVYQRALLTGSEALSGSTLTGKAARYGAHYARSRQNLLRRLTRAGVPWTEARGAHGKRILVLGRAGTAVVLLGGDADKVGVLVENVDVFMTPSEV